jgi:hypothetical protein
MKAVFCCVLKVCGIRGRWDKEGAIGRRLDSSILKNNKPRNDSNKDYQPNIVTFDE